MIWNLKIQKCNVQSISKKLNNTSGIPGIPGIGPYLLTISNIAIIDVRTYSNDYAWATFILTNKTNSVNNLDIILVSSCEY